MEDCIYLDNAATTPLAPEVIELMTDLMKNQFGNPSSSHSVGRHAKTIVEQSRRTVANCINAEPKEIVFTSGGTEADNIAIRCSVYDLGCKHIITSEIEHSAVVKTSEILKSRGAVEVHIVKLDEKGHVDLVHLEELLGKYPNALVSLMHANNEIGNVLPLKKVGEICKKYDAIFHSDTVQSMGHFPIDVKDLHVHFITGAAHKFHGPKGTGFLYSNMNTKIKGNITGGGQERNMRGGTENIYGIAGLSLALELSCNEMESHKNHIQGLKNRMIQKLEENFEDVAFNGDSKSPNALYTVLNACMPENENSGMLLFLLDIEGVCVSGGSACSSGAAQGSHVIRGINAYRENRANIRFSFSRYTKESDVDACIEILKKLCLKNNVESKMA